MPRLAEAITDTRLSKVKHDPFGVQLTVGDMAVFAISDIVRGYRFLDLLEEPFRSDAKETGVNAYFRCVKADARNRARLRDATKTWLTMVTRDLVWHKETIPHPAGGYYVVQQAKPVGRSAATQPAAKPAPAATQGEAKGNKGSKQPVKIVTFIVGEDEDELPPGLFAYCPPLVQTVTIPPKAKYEVALESSKRRDNPAHLAKELTGRLAGVYPTQGTIEVAEEYRQGHTLTIRLRFIEENRSDSGWPADGGWGGSRKMEWSTTDDQSIYIEGWELGRDLPPGRYTINVELDEYIRQGDKVAPAPADKPRHRERVSCNLTIEGPGVTSTQPEPAPSASKPTSRGDGDGAKLSVRIVVTPPEPGPPPLGVNLWAELSGKSDGGETYLWDLGQLGGKSKLKSPNALIRQPGDYPIRVTVTSRDGTTCTGQTTITVPPAPPRAVAPPAAAPVEPTPADQVIQALDQACQMVVSLAGWTRHPQLHGFRKVPFQVAANRQEVTLAFNNNATQPEQDKPAVAGDKSKPFCLVSVRAWREDGGGPADEPARTFELFVIGGEQWHLKVASYSDDPRVTEDIRSGFVGAMWGAAHPRVTPASSATQPAAKPALEGSLATRPDEADSNVPVDALRDGLKAVLGEPFEYLGGEIGRTNATAGSWGAARFWVAPSTSTLTGSCPPGRPIPV